MRQLTLKPLTETININIQMICIIFLSLILSSVSASHVDRSLYDLSLPDRKVVNVTTIIQGLNRPIGVTYGSFNNMAGVFVTSFVTSDIRFVETNAACEAAGNCQSVVVAGNGLSGFRNGSLDSATFSDPSRMVYVQDQNVLVITDRANGYIRYINFNTDYVGTITKSDGTKISILSNTRPDNQPGTDIRYYNNYFYLTDGINVYNLTGSNGDLTTAFSSATLRRYQTLRQWQLKNDYDSSNRKIFITSIEIDSNRKVMYVSYTQSRSALVIVPIQCSSSSEISILYSDGILWDSDKIFTIGYPKPRNGNLNSAPVTGFALVTYPMHLFYDNKNDILYWTEVYSHLSSGTSVGALGAVALRRLNLATKEVDYYAGDEGTFRSILGRTTGFRDGACNRAQFSYPMTVAYNDKDSLGPHFYITDYGNNAIRRVSTLVNTPSPTLFPTISVRPTFRPSISNPPTFSPSRIPTDFPTSNPSGTPSVQPSTSQPSSSTPSFPPTGSPTGIPSSAPTMTLAPTRSMAPSSIPTELNGDCFEILLTDEFGDGWGGAVLQINHTLPSPKPPPKQLPHPPLLSQPHPRLSTTSTRLSYDPSKDSESQTHRICASLDENRVSLGGVYTIQIVTGSIPLTKFPLHWEIGFQISTRNENHQNTVIGEATTLVELEFTEEGNFAYKRIESPKTTLNSCEQCRHPPPHPNDKSQEPVPKHPPNFPMVLKEPNREMWYRGDVSFTRFVIYTPSMNEIIQSGMMCSREDTEICDLSLDDGDYYFRVGANTEGIEAVWSFCGASGGAQEEISFSIMNGRCVMGHHINLQTLLNSVEKTVLSLEGEFLVENVFSSEISVSDQRIIEDALASVLQIRSQTITLLDFCPTSPGVTCSMTRIKKNHGRMTQSLSSSRLLSETFAYHITFLVNVKIEDENGYTWLVGSEYKHITQFVNDLKQRYVEAVNGGTLQSTIRTESESRTGNSLLSTIHQPSSTKEIASTLQFARIPNVLSLELVAVTYEYTPKTQSPSISPVEYASLSSIHLVVNETLQQEIFLFTPIFFVVSALVFIVILHQSRRSNHSETNPMDSLSCAQRTSASRTTLNSEGDSDFVERSLRIIPDTHTSQRFQREGNSTDSIFLPTPRRDEYLPTLDKIHDSVPRSP